METTFDSSSVNAALIRIKNTLNYSLKENYGIEDPEITEKFLHMHGLDKSRFDFINNFETLIEKGIADESVDTNSNKCDKSIIGYFSETALPIRKLVGYRYLYRKMKDMYGKKRAKYLSGLMYDMSLALADSTNILVPYCYSINASKLVMEGRPFGSLPSGIPHRVNSYINTLCEIVHQLSNHLAGAIAIGSFFLDIAHVMIYREHKTLEDLRNPEYREYIKNSMQCFIHSMNHLSRNAVESPFTNISIFDAPKLRALIADDNMGWYFQKEDIIDGIPENALEDCESRPTMPGATYTDKWIEYIIIIIKELQSIFMSVMDKGDPLHDNRPIEFPVTTFNISRKSKEDGSFEFEDPDWVRYFCDNHDIFRYNVYVSEGMKIASCCRLVNDFSLIDLGGQVNSFGGTGISLGSHRVLTINMRRISLQCNSFEDYKKRLTQKMEEAADILIAHKNLIKDLVVRGTQPFIDNGWLELDRMFSTFGLMGYYEANEDLKKKFGGDDYLPEIISYIDAESRRISSERKNVFNVEQIPGESMSKKLPLADSWLFGEESIEYPLYANQFVPLWEDVTLREKFEREGKLASQLTGGGIIHFSLGERLTPKQAYNIIEDAVKYSCEYFALNPTYSKCEKGHYIFGKHEYCPIDGSPIVSALSRVVGFFTETTNWSKEKREYDYNKRNYRKTGF